MRRITPAAGPVSNDTRVAAESAPPRILLVAPQPFYEDRGTPIAVKHVLEALSEGGYKVDLLTYPVGKAIELPGLRAGMRPQSQVGQNFLNDVGLVNEGRGGAVRGVRR